MVRTYAFNASSRSEIFEQFKHTAAAPRFNPENHNNFRSQDTVTSSYTNDNRKFVPSESPVSTTTTNSMTDSSSHLSNQENNNQYMNNVFPPLNQSNIYQSSFHSSIIDPLNSIIALRPLYMNGQLVYMPVEPHINMMINKEFGGIRNQVQPVVQQPVVLPQIQPNMPILAQNAAQPYQEMLPPHSMVRSQSRNDVYQNRQDPPTQASLNRQSANQQYRQNTINAKYGSLPNLSQRTGQEQYKLSSQEQHKLELQQQIEDNKRRKALEKQKEIELEQREIRNYSTYSDAISKPEKRRRPSIPQQQQQQQYRPQQRYDDYDSYGDNEEPIRPARQQNMRNSNSFSEYSEQRPSSRLIRNQPRYEQQYNVAREQRPDSTQPREVEWWEKKQQNKIAERQSAVIPTLRGKPPAVPDSQRSGYDSSGYVGEHQSRPSSRTSRTTSSTQRSSDVHSEEPISRNPSGRRRAPTAFTVDA
ncbi:hypothetical protein GCK72_023556 [Caenorhabditis remanei]|uniref:Uncharacterized protein n=1 Tax=Caenorhabditis remanei TaxID=31234 RepID=A0A6A5FX65_CAERE|nr:hypothetical protein GCK72_023556 [Caenorhabditis remanei]KAF1747097.1 hypothetical protein GCK72_023556 [Caenorhabditis remanei]